MALLALLFSGCEIDENTLSTRQVGESSLTTDLILRKSVDKENPKPRDTIYYTVGVQNQGKISATDISIKDSCPDLSTFEGVFTQAGTYDPSSGEWRIEKLDAQDSALLVFGCSLDPASSGSAIETPVQEVSLNEFDVNLKNNFPTVTINVIPEIANLVTSNTVSKAIAVASESLIYSLAVENKGPDNAAEASLTFLCPQGTTYESVVEPQGSSYNNGTGLWTIGDIALDETVVLEVSCKIDNSLTEFSSSSSSAVSSALDISVSGDVLSNQTEVVSQCSQSFSTVTTYSQFGDGLGAASAFEIGNPAQLVDLAENGQEDWDKTFIFCQGLDMAPITDAFEIGTSTDPFTGVILGNNQVISNYDLKGGIISYGQDLSISNLSFASSSVECEDNYCSFFVDHLSGSGTSSLSNLSVSADSNLSSTNAYVGAFIGNASSVADLQLSQLSNRANITAETTLGANQNASYAGGIVGNVAGSGVTASNLENYGNIISDGSYVGGIMGLATLAQASQFTTISNHGSLTCSQLSAGRDFYGGLFGDLKALPGAGIVQLSDLTSAADITTGAGSNVNYIGGIAGRASGFDGSNYLAIDNAVVTGDVDITNTTSALSQFAGGFIGYFSGDATVNDASRITNSSSRATVTAGRYAGGFVGMISNSATIDSSSSHGNVTSNDVYVGGFAGRVEIYSSISNSNMEALNVEGNSSVGGFVGYMANFSSGTSTAEINNCHVTSANVTANTGYAGGFVSNLYDSGRIIDSSVTLLSFTTNGTNYAGGFAAYVDSNNEEGAGVVISNSHVYAPGVTMQNNPAIDYAGGFIGRLYKGAHTISGSSTNLSVMGDRYVGGFVGFAEGNMAEMPNVMNISNSFAEGAVDCNHTCGGFGGQIQSNTHVDNAYSAGNVTAMGSSSYVGGFVGVLGGISKVQNSHVTGDVESSNTYIGGFVGRLAGEADILDSYVSNNHIKGKGGIAGFAGQIDCNITNPSDDGNCQTLRNYVKTALIDDYAGGAAGDFSAAGFAYLVETNNSDIEVRIEDNFTSYTELRSKKTTGGFTGVLRAYGASTDSAIEIHIKRNFVKGALTLYASTPGFIGGFLADMQSGSTNQNGAFYIEDNYSDLTFDLSAVPATTTTVGMGGFIGRQLSYDSSFFRRNYSNVASIDANSSSRYVGGFVGWRDNPASGHLDTTFDNNIAVSTEVANVPSNADFFAGLVQASTSALFSGNYYNSEMTCADTPCDASNGGTGVALTTLQGNSTNAPLNTWDFVNVWETRAGNLPKLRCPALGSVDFCLAWDNEQL